MRKLFVIFVLAALAIFSPSAFASTKTRSVAKARPVAVSSAQKPVAPSESEDSSEKKRAMEDVNSLIIDSYKARLDRTLAELYDNIRVATKGDKGAQIQILTKIRGDLDDRLDNLADTDVTENRKKILLGVYFYLKSSIEAQIRDLKWEHDDDK